MDGGKLIIEAIFDALNEVGLIIKNTARFLQVFFASLFDLINVGAKFGKMGSDAESISGDTSGGEAKSIGK